MGTSPEVSPLQNQLIVFSSTTGSVSGGNFKLAYGSSTACNAYTTTASTLAGYIAALTTFPVGQVSVVASGPVSGGLTFTIAFTGGAQALYPLIATTATGCTLTSTSGTPSVSSTTVTPTYNITGLTQGITYYVRVTAHNSLGYGSPSLVSSNKPDQEPSRATNVFLSIYGDNDLQVRLHTRVCLCVCECTC